MGACGPVRMCQPRTWKDFFGVWLNVKRVHLQWAFAAGRGAGLVHGRKTLIDPEYFHADALTPGEARALEETTNLARTTASAAAKEGFSQ